MSTGADSAQGDAPTTSWPRRSLFQSGSRRGTALAASSAVGLKDSGVGRKQLLMKATQPRRVAGYPIAPGDVPALGVNLPVQQPRAESPGRRLNEFPRVCYPDLDKRATHGLTLPRRCLMSVVLPAEMVSF